jgi:hypothetical protein
MNENGEWITLDVPTSEKLAMLTKGELIGKFVASATACEVAKRAEATARDQAVFLAEWIEQKYRDSDRITARDYRECMDWLAKMRGGLTQKS